MTNAEKTPTKKDALLTKEAQGFADRMFPCEKPCDSYSVCESCCERSIFEAGYNFGFRAKEEVQ